jgi:phosphodiesterase/alkaline phosphatase D-like protein
VTVDGNGSYTSNAFTVAAPGTYRFIASYSGDVNDAPAAGACNAPAEVVTVPPPVIAVTDSASPTSMPAPGGTFTFSVQVSNPSTVDPITITTLNDNIYGNLATVAGSTCDSLIGVTLAPGASSPACSFPGSFTGTAGASQTDTVSATGTDSAGFTATATSNATVTITTAAPGPPTVTTGAASNVTGTTASLAGTVTPNGADAKFVFEYGESTSFGSISSIADAGSGFSPVPVTGTLSGLSPGTTYFYRAVSTNSFGTTSATVKTFTTPGPSTAPVVVTLAPVSAGTTSAVLAGTVNPSGQATAFTIEYGPTTSFGSITPVVELDSSNSPESVTATATGLAPDTTYLYRVVATNATGTTAGAVKSVTTGPGSLPVATTGPATAITSTGASLTGTVDPNSSPTSFVFEYGLTTGFGSISAVDSAGSMAGAQSVSLPIGSLTPGTTYLYRIDATNANGTVTGVVRSFTTAAG